MPRLLSKMFVANLFFVSGLTLGAIVEKPIYSEDTLSGKTQVIGLIQFSRFADDKKAFRKVNSRVIRFYERNTWRSDQNPREIDLYTVWDINCRNGNLKLISMGELSRMSAVKNVPAFEVKERNSQNLPVYREICTSMGIKPTW